MSIEKCNKKWWERFSDISLVLNSPGSCDCVSVVRCTALAPDRWQRHQKGNHSVLAWPTCNVKVVLLLQTWGLLHGQDGKFSTGYLILESRFSQLNWHIYEI